MSAAARAVSDMSSNIIQRIADGRTDLVFDWVADGHPATATDPHGAALSSCARITATSAPFVFCSSKGESLESLGDNFGLNEAVFHGHWQLVQFLLEQGADVNLRRPTPARPRCTRPSAKPIDPPTTWS